MLLGVLLIQTLLYAAQSFEVCPGNRHISKGYYSLGPGRRISVPKWRSGPVSSRYVPLGQFAIEHHRSVCAINCIPSHAVRYTSLPAAAALFSPAARRSWTRMEDRKTAISHSYHPRDSSLYALDPVVAQRLGGIKLSYDVMSDRIASLSNGAAASAEDRGMLVSLLKERADLDRIITPYSEYLVLEKQLNESFAMEASLTTVTSREQKQPQSDSSASEDAEILEMLRQDRALIQESMRGLEDMILAALIPRDPLDDRGVMLELRQGTGGSEACLFARDLLDAYSRYATMQGWTCERVSETEGEGGGPLYVI